VKERLRRCGWAGLAGPFARSRTSTTRGVRGIAALAVRGGTGAFLSCGRYHAFCRAWERLGGLTPCAAFSSTSKRAFRVSVWRRGRVRVSTLLLSRRAIFSCGDVRLVLLLTTSVRNTSLRPHTKHNVTYAVFYNVFIDVPSIRHSGASRTHNFPRYQRAGLYLSPPRLAAGWHERLPSTRIYLFLWYAIPVLPPWWRHEGAWCILSFYHAMPAVSLFSRSVAPLLLSVLYFALDVGRMDAWRCSCRLCLVVSVYNPAGRAGERLSSFCYHLYSALSSCSTIILCSLWWHGLTALVCRCSNGELTFGCGRWTEELYALWRLMYLATCGGVAERVERRLCHLTSCCSRLALPATLRLSYIQRVRQGLWRA